MLWEWHIKSFSLTNLPALFSFSIFFLHFPVSIIPISPFFTFFGYLKQFAALKTTALWATSSKISASEMTYILSGRTLNTTHWLTLAKATLLLSVWNDIELVVIFLCTVDRVYSFGWAMTRRSVISCQVRRILKVFSCDVEFECVCK